MRSLTSPLLLVGLALVGCSATGSDSEEVVVPASPAVLAREAGVALTGAPFVEVHTQWKERLPQPYVFFEHRGPRETFGESMRSLLEYAVRQRINTDGHPFGLFGEDGSIRACLPVDTSPGRARVGFDILPQAMVSYAVVQGPYPQASLALPGLRTSMADNGWEQRGPVREIYLVNPAEVLDYRGLATEVQVPWAVMR